MAGDPEILKIRDEEVDRKGKMAASNLDITVLRD